MDCLLTEASKREVNVARRRFAFTPVVCVTKAAQALLQTELPRIPSDREGIKGLRIKNSHWNSCALRPPPVLAAFLSDSAADMNVSGIHHGTLRMHSGFLFKQWKKRFLLLTAEGSLLVCHDASSPPEQLVLLQSGCEAIVEGKEILDLPKLPSGGRRDCCFALILPHDKYLLLLADSPADCSQWLNMLKKVKQSVSPPLGLCKRHQVQPLHISLKDLVPEQILDKEPPTPPPPLGSAEAPSPPTCVSPREKGRNSPGTKYHKGSAHSVGCLRHGTISNAQTMRAVYLLMGGAAASSAMGYLGSCSPSNLEAKAPDLPLSADFSDMGPTAYHPDSTAVGSPHFNSFDFEVADSDFGGFDYGGFSF